MIFKCTVCDRLFNRDVIFDGYLNICFCGATLELVSEKKLIEEDPDYFVKTEHPTASC